MRLTFNSNFYLTTATVIPLLYLALILQASIIGDILTKLNHAIETVSKWRPRFDVVGFLMYVIYIVATLLVAAATLIIVGGVVGEIIAITALFHQSDTQTQRQSVLNATIILLIATVLAPTWTIVTGWGRVLWQYLKTQWKRDSR